MVLNLRDMRLLFLCLLFSVFYIDNALFAAYPGDSYFTVAGGLKTSYNLNLNLPFEVPDQIRKDKDGSKPVDTTSVPSVKTAATTFVNENENATVSKNVSFGIGGTFGYAFNRYFKGEIEGAYYGGRLTSSSGWYPYLNAVQQKEQSLLTKLTTSTPANTAIDDRFSNFDIMANVVCDVENQSNIVPFAGAGFGASIDNFWGTSIFVFQYHFFGGIDLILTPYLYATLNFDYMKSKNGDTIMRLKKKKTFTDTGAPAISSSSAPTFPQASIGNLINIAKEFKDLQAAYNANTAAASGAGAGAGAAAVALNQAKNDYNAAIAKARTDGVNPGLLLSLMSKNSADYNAEATKVTNISDIAKMGITTKADYELLALARMVDSKPPVQSSLGATALAAITNALDTNEYIVFDASSSVNSKVTVNDNRFRVTAGLKFII